MLSQLKSMFVAAGLAALSLPAAADATKVTIGGGPYLDIPQLSVAMDRNLWAEQGLEAEVIPFQSGRAAFEALLGGQLDFAFLAEFPAVIGAMRDQKFAVIAEMSQYTATRLVHTGGSDVTKVADLAGKPVGVTAGTNVHFMLENELKAAGIEAEIVSVGPPDIVPALARGDVFAGAMFPSFYQGAKKTLGDRYSEIRIDSYGTHFILVATRKMIDESPQAVTGVLQALYNGEEVVLSDPAEAHAAVSRVLSGTLKPDDVAAAWGNYRHNMNLNSALLDLMVREGVWIHARGSIKGDVPTVELMRAYVAPKFLAGINADRVSLD